jgi:hypothetical protein
MKIIAFDLELSFGAETYVCSVPISSTVPVGVPEVLSFPERQHSDTPTPVDIVDWIESWQLFPKYI